MVLRSRGALVHKNAMRAANNSERESGAVIPIRERRTQLLLVPPHGITGLSTTQFLPSLIVLAPLLRESGTDLDSSYCDAYHTRQGKRHNSLIGVTSWGWLWDV